MANLTGAQALIQSLAREGVEVVFGLPGVQIMEIYDALYEQFGIRLITVRHEQSAGYMADGYARTTGRVGVALVVPGPGPECRCRRGDRLRHFFTGDADFRSGRQRHAGAEPGRPPRGRRPARRL